MEEKKVCCNVAPEFLCARRTTNTDTGREMEPEKASLPASPMSGPLFAGEKKNRNDRLPTLPLPSKNNARHSSNSDAGRLPLIMSFPNAALRRPPLGSRSFNDWKATNHSLEKEQLTIRLQLLLRSVSSPDVRSAIIRGNESARV